MEYSSSDPELEQTSDIGESTAENNGITTMQWMLYAYKKQNPSVSVIYMLSGVSINS